MLFSKDELFSDDQAITASAISTNIIDLGDKGAGFANGQPVEVVIQVTQAFATCDSLTVDIRTDADDGLTSGHTVLATSAAILTASLVPGYRFVLRFVPDGTERYIGLYYTIGGSNATAGKVTAGIVLASQTNL